MAKAENRTRPSEVSADTFPPSMEQTDAADALPLRVDDLDLASLEELLSQSPHYWRERYSKSS